MNFAPLLARPVNPAIARAARYFQELAPGDALPKRSDFRPTRVPSLLGFYFLIDVLPGDYRYSLAGEHTALLFGLDATHMKLSEFGDPAQIERLKKTYDAVVASRSFHYVRGRYCWPERAVAIERILVPLADRDGHLTTILGASIPDKNLASLSLMAGNGPASLEIDVEIRGPL